MLAGKAEFSLFGVFDGHGGKQAATFAAKHMASCLLAALPSVDASDEEVDLVRSILGHESLQLGTHLYRSPRFCHLQVENECIVLYTSLN